MVTMNGFCPTCYQQTTGDMLDGSGWCPDHGKVMVEFQRPKPPVEIRDAEGQDVRRGMTVVEDGREVGYVTAITEREESASVDVTVSYAVEGDETWTAWVNPKDPDGPRTCDDITVKEEA